MASIISLAFGLVPLGLAYSAFLLLTTVLFICKAAAFERWGVPHGHIMIVALGLCVHAGAYECDPSRVGKIFRFQHAR